MKAIGWREYDIIEAAVEAYVSAWISKREKPPDVGSCIMGNGVSVNVIPKRCRRGQSKLLCSNASMGLQCEYPDYQELVDELNKKFGRYFQYEYGRMD